MAMSIEAQQKLLAAQLDETLAALMRDNPDVSPRVISFTLIDFACLLASRQGATLQHVTARAERVWKMLEMAAAKAAVASTPVESVPDPDAEPTDS